MQVSLTDWRPLRRNSLLGFASIRVGALLIKDVTLHSNKGKRWAGLPAKPRINAGGEIMKDERGKISCLDARHRMDQSRDRRSILQCRHRRC